MSNRIKNYFSALKKEGRVALVGYLTAGYPDMEKSEADIRLALSSGVDVLEIGVPFSDSTADGPVIQAAGHTALSAGVTLEKILDMVSRIRRDFKDKPMILFSYANPLFSYGYEKLCDDATLAGIDGMLVVDMPFEESRRFQKLLESRELVLIPLIAPTTPGERVKKILSHAKGFVYYIMVRGVTGERAGLAADAHNGVSMIREFTRLPVVAGFGITGGEQAAEVAAWADGVVVGSALVKAAGEGRLGKLVEELAVALRQHC